MNTTSDTVYPDLSVEIPNQLIEGESYRQAHTSLQSDLNSPTALTGIFNDNRAQQQERNNVVILETDSWWMASVND